MKLKPHILDWSSRAQWLPELPAYTADILAPDVVDFLRDNPPDGCWSDDMSWLPDESLVDNFIDAFCNYYESVKAFHGCRPIEMASYYNDGLLGQDGRHVETTFRNLYADVPGDVLQRAIDGLRERGEQEHGKIYFVCTEEELVTQCGHYLIQGSEYLMSLAAALCRHHTTGEDFRMRLRDFGIPTIIEVNIPIELIPDWNLREMAQVMISAWGKQILNLEDDGEPRMYVILNQDLPAKYIVNHSHPREIRDPHVAYSTYRPPVTVCEWC
jgi:hypothetical protein